MNQIRGGGHLRLRQDNLSFDLRYLVNYVRYQKSVYKIEFYSIDYPPDQIWSYYFKRR